MGKDYNTSFGNSTTVSTLSFSSGDSDCTNSNNENLALIGNNADSESQNIESKPLNELLSEALEPYCAIS